MRQIQHKQRSSTCYFHRDPHVTCTFVRLFTRFCTITATTDGTKRDTYNFSLLDELLRRLSELVLQQERINAFIKIARDRVLLRHLYDAPCGQKGRKWPKHAAGWWWHKQTMRWWVPRLEKHTLPLHKTDGGLSLIERYNKKFNCYFFMNTFNSICKTFLGIFFSKHALCCFYFG